MAILEKIRKRSLLLILIIGLALFSFIISDFIGSGKFSYGGSKNIAEVNGDAISADSFHKRVENITTQNSYQSLTQVVNRIWENLVNAKVISQQTELAGLIVSPGSTPELIKTQPMFTSSPIFQNEKGVFDINKVLEYILDLKTNNPAGYENWKLQEQELLEYFKQQSYFNLIKSGVIATPIEGEYSYKSESDMVDFSYVSIPYNSIPDKDVTISDKEIANYLENHKSEFEREKTRNLKFVYFEEKPSPEDERAALESLQKLLKPSLEYNAKTHETDTVPPFGEVEDVKNYVNSKSDVSFQDQLIFKSSLPQDVSNAIVELKPNQTFGPYKDGSAFKLVRLLNTRKIADSSKASHIFVRYISSPVNTGEAKMTKEQAKNYIDSIFKVVKENPKKFAEIADQINEDGSKGKGGDIGWQRYSEISYDNFDKNFAEFMFFKNVGNMEIIESQMGIHVVKIDSQGAKKDAYKLATIVRHVDPSEETINTIYTKASQFQADAIEGKTPFETLAKNQQLQVSDAPNLIEFSDYLSFLGSQRGIIKWAFGDDVKKGSIKLFNVSKGYVVVLLDEAFEKGLMPIEQARPLVTPTLQRKKKAEILKTKYNSSSMEQIAAATNTSIQTVSGLTAKRPFASGFFGEETVVGTALSMNSNESSPLIEGFLGVFKIRVSAIQKAEALPNYSSYSDALNITFNAQLETNIHNALKKLSKIEDNRANFY